LFMKEGYLCPQCRKGKLRKPKVFYSVFEGKKQPDSVCEQCGAFYWEHPDLTIPSPVLQPAKQEEERAPTFGELLKEEEKRREGTRRKSRV